MPNTSSAPAVWTPVPLPQQVPVNEGRTKLPGTTLWYWDTGGQGPAVILLHAASGSGAFWGYQQPVLAKAGYRVISYSRRGYLKSDPGDPNDPGIASEDLHNLVGFLDLEKFHAVGLAAGGIVATDYALSHPERLLSLTLTSTIIGVTDKELPRSLQHLPPAHSSRSCRRIFRSSARPIARAIRQELRRGARSRKRR